MSVQFHYDEFMSDFKRYVSMSQRELPVICNSRAYHIALKAINYTKRMPLSALEPFDRGEAVKKVQLRARSEKVMNVISWTKRTGGKRVMTIRLKKKKFITRAKNKTTKFHKVSPEFRRIFVSRLRKKGVNPRSLGGGDGGEFELRASKSLQGRKASAAFLASGWVPVIKKLASVVPDRGQGIYSGVKVTGKAKGYALAAKSGWNPVAIIVNSSMGPTKFQSAGSSGRVDGFIKSGLEEAFANEKQEMIRHMSEKMNKVGDSFKG